MLTQSFSYFKGTLTTTEFERSARIFQFATTEPCACVTHSFHQRIYIFKVLTFRGDVPLRTPFI